MVKNPNRKKLQAAETKQRLYNSAKVLLAKNDFNDVSVDSIVQAAGVSKGTFYVHFESKDALLASLLSDHVKSVDLGYRSFLDALPDTMPASEVMLAFIGKIADVLNDDIGYENMATVYRLQLTSFVETSAVKGYARELYAMFHSILDRGQRRGEFAIPLSVEELAKHFVMAIRGLSYEWCIRYPDFDLKAQATEHFKILLSGIRASRP